MELTNVLGKLKSDKEAPKPFLALVVTNELVQAAVWHVDQGETKVAALGTPVEWDGDQKDQNELVQAVDATVSAAIEGLPVEPNQIIYGLPETWTTKDGIAEDRLKIIKYVSDELELKALGFVVVKDSLLKYLKMQEGTPSTSILIQVKGNELTLHLVRLGRIEATQVVGRSDDIATDVEEGISRFQVSDNLPSRIIVFDGMHNLEDVVQNLVSYDWQSKFNFLHIPKVESLPKDVLIQSVAVAGGAEVAKSLGFEVADKSNSSEKVAAPIPTPPPAPSKPVETEPEPDSQESVPAPADNNLTAVPLASAEELGFSSPDSPPPPPPPSPQAPPAPPASPPPPPPPKPSRRARPSFSFQRLFARLPKPSFSSFSLGHPGVIAALALFAVVLVIGIFVWFVPKATVTIFVDPKTLSETIPLTLSTEVSSPDPDNSLVPATLVDTTVSGSSSLPTTGKKTVGDPASGEVVIFNRSDLVKTFPAGTTITASGLDFKLDNDVTVASSSAGPDYVDVPGRATVAVTAVAIGEDGNLGEDTEFVIEDFSTSTYVARNESSLSGGSSQEIQVVARDDLDKLVAELTADLADRAKDELLQSSDLGSGIYILEDSLEVTDESYSDQVGEEANTVEAELEVTVQAVRFNTQDVEILVDSAIDSSVPEGYFRTDDLPSVELSSAQEEDGVVEGEAKVEVRLLPDLDVNEISTALRGVAASQVEEVLSTIVGMSSARVEITPRFLPPRLKRMPRNVNSITIIILPTSE